MSYSQKLQTRIFTLVAGVLSLLIALFTANSPTTEIVGLEWRFKLHSTTPIKNSTSKKSANHHYYLDANDIAKLISETTKEGVAFSQAVTDWSEEIFIPADCYIPLCRTDPAEISWQLSDTLFIPDSSMQFESCCALADTRLPEDDPDSEECIVNPLQSCRTQVYEAPCGSVIDADSGIAFESEAVCSNETAIMEIQAEFFDLEDNEVCCVQCACFGDPRCVSFNGTSDIWVLCDARRPKDLLDLDSRCSIEEDMCLTQLDHENRQCQWINLTIEEEENWKVLTNGSRCQPNSLSGESWIVMYEFNEFALEVRQIDRGVIDAVELRLEDEVYQLQAEDCDTASFNASWKQDDAFVAPPQSFVQVLQTVDTYQEVVWAISQTETAMHVRLRCLRQRNDEGEVSPPRIHIEALVEPEANLEGRDNVNGFCVTTEFEEGGTRSNTELIESGEGCTVSDLTKIEQMEIVRSLCGHTVAYGNIPSCLVSFCEENFFPSFLDSMQCVISFGDGVEGFNFKETFCKAMTFVEADALECEFIWDDISPIEAISVYYLNANPPDLEENCAPSFDDLPQELGECEAGVELQYLNEELEWITFVGIPERRPPCSNLNLNIIDHRPVFVNPIRWKQCNIPSSCLTATNTLCRTQTQFNSDIILHTSSSGLPTKTPTTAPTQFPTNSPTFSPQVLPTAFPSESPTEEALPTEFPTESPTTSPTIEGTSSPTETVETNFPTESPTQNPTDDIPMQQPTPNPTHMVWGQGTPTFEPTESPTLLPTTEPTPFPTFSPTTFPSKSPTPFPTNNPTPFPTISPTANPTTGTPTESPTISPTWNPTVSPTLNPTLNPTISPTLNPTTNPTSFPTRSPSVSPTFNPTTSPTKFPTVSPTNFPTESPTFNPTTNPTSGPTESPTSFPTGSPIESPTESPTISPIPHPTESPTVFPTESPTTSPTSFPTQFPSWSPSKFPTAFPTKNPTASPIPYPTESPTLVPTKYPSVLPTESPTLNPTESPTLVPTDSPSVVPTHFPTEKLEWGNGQVFLNTGTRAKKTTERRAIMQQRIATTRKLDYAEAGEVVFYAMYKTEDAAERELLVSDPVATLTLINTLFSEKDRDVVAVHCDMSLLVATVETEGYEGADGSTEPTENWDFFDLGSNFGSIALLVGLLFAAMFVGIILCNVSSVSLPATSSELIHKKLDL